MLARVKVCGFHPSHTLRYSPRRQTNAHDAPQNRFNIHLHAPTIAFVYLSTRHLVLATTWPRFTLLGQSLGSLIMAWDAFTLVVPDIFVDTMGYAFALGLSRLLFRRVPTCAYVHYPTISTDMLESLDPSSPLGSKGVNAGQGTGLRGFVKRWYWRAFAAMYSRVGATVDSVMTNSSWTQAHIQKLWGPHRRRKTLPITVNYPPVAVTELESKIELTPATEARREKILLLIAQFRPEKDHQHMIQSFARFAKSGTEAAKGARLVLVGSVRDDADSKRVYQLRLLVNELNVKDRVEFHTDASWPEVLEWLRRASVGVNGMWNEHFGIGVVEYQAAGLISVVHASGGPKMDIVVDIDGEPTGKIRSPPPPPSPSIICSRVAAVGLTKARFPRQYGRRVRRGLRKGPLAPRPPGRAAAGPRLGEALHGGGVHAEVDRSDGGAGRHAQVMQGWSPGPLSSDIILSILLPLSLAGFTYVTRSVNFSRFIFRRFVPYSVSLPCFRGAMWVS